MRLVQRIILSGFLVVMMICVLTGMMITNDGSGRQDFDYFERRIKRNSFVNVRKRPNNYNNSHDDVNFERREKVKEASEQVTNTCTNI